MNAQLCNLLHHAPLQAGYWTLTLDAKAIADTAAPGQFVHVRVPTLEDSALRRPFSIFGASDGKLHILYKVVGRGTGKMNTFREGDTVNVLGPLGNGFPLTPAGVPLLVAGGYGVAPLCFLAERLPCKGIVFIGGRTADDILVSDRFERMGWPVCITTEDGSQGEAGLVTLPLDREIARLKAEGRQVELYACGPDGMLKAVSQRAMDNDAPGWLSLDNHMVCGIGACLACVQDIRAPDGTIRRARTCTDGPVFEARKIVW
ncbi:MAG: dihydroorotate dehydrogenase electron transfer subunit [Kiritimatiellaeota bacterium]|nr:dihydroorotate dehydrogenase electron transfer subunit [Kiritimatiellota bacterium]